MADMFMKVKDIPGESTDDKHPEWIELSSFSFGANQAGTVARSVGSSTSDARVDFSDFTVTKLRDKASPKLLLALAQGTPIDEITIEMCRASGDKSRYTEYKFKHVLISNYSLGAGGGVPTETLQLKPGEFSDLYTQLDEKGKSKGDVKMKWSLIKNKGE
jgi:type VI secretion system secreted protein Hcp